jgi:DNA-binding GntR family transcriptional regulator
MNAAASGSRSRQVERISAPSLVDRVADQLVSGIASGRIHRGERLIEADLAEDLGISRIPLREAMSVLETQGILVAEVRRGRRVAEFGAAQVRDVCETRLALERLAVKQAQATYKRDPGRIAALDLVLNDMRTNLERGSTIQDLNYNDVRFHAEVYAATDNSYLQTLWDMLARHVMIVFALETFHRHEPAENYKQHQILRNLLLSGSPEELDQEIEAHILSYGGGIAPRV